MHTLIYIDCASWPLTLRRIMHEDLDRKATVKSILVKRAICSLVMATPMPQQTLCGYNISVTYIGWDVSVTCLVLVMNRAVVSVEDYNNIIGASGGSPTVV